MSANALQKLSSFRHINILDGVSCNMETLSLRILSAIFHGSIISSSSAMLIPCPFADARMVSVVNTSNTQLDAHKIFCSCPPRSGSKCAIKLDRDL